MSEKRCRYISIRVDQIHLPVINHPLLSQTLRMPAYTCLLADAMGDRLRSLPDGQALTDINARSDWDENSHSQIGPDMQLLSMPACTSTRCTQRCTPAFVDLMTDLGLDSTLPETG